MCNKFSELLPDHLRERIRFCDELPITPLSGAFILYWMRSAVRADENPALDAACLFANDTGLPLLVYHGLSENYSFASDRHHTFMLQGARDVQQQFFVMGFEKQYQTGTTSGS